MNLRIILADDHKILRQGLRSLLEARLASTIVAEAEDGEATVELTRELVPDIVIMDVTMPTLNGIEATRIIASELPDVKIIALSMHSDKRFVAEMLAVGASGYLLKDCAFEEIAIAIKSVVNGQTYISPGIMDGSQSAKQFVESLLSERPFASLTLQERRVLKMVAEGKPTKKIASELNVSTKTVEKHRTKLMEKLNVHSVAELTKQALRFGITTLEE